MYRLQPALSLSGQANVNPLLPGALGSKPGRRRDADEVVNPPNGSP